MRCSRGALLVLFAGGLIGCAGARFDLKADSAKYPISFSPALPDEKGTPLFLDQDLEKRGDFSVATTKFGFFYSATGGTIDVSDEVNEAVSSRRGDGIVNFSVDNKNCASNYLFPLNFLPFFPGCQAVTVSGVVVKARDARAR